MAVGMFEQEFLVGPDECPTMFIVQGWIGDEEFKGAFAGELEELGYSGDGVTLKLCGDVVRDWALRTPHGEPGDEDFLEIAPVRFSSMFMSSDDKSEGEWEQVTRCLVLEAAAESANESMHPQTEPEL